MDIGILFESFPPSIAQGLLWGVMAIGVYTTYKILNFADLSVDGSLALGGAVGAVAILSGQSPWVALVLATLSGMAAGFVTGILHTVFGIPDILAGILKDKDDNFIYCLCGDGESEEGQIWEAGMFAVHHKLDNLVAMTDWNGQQIDGTVASVAGEGDLEAKWKAWDWNVIVADGHDFAAIAEAFAAARANKGSGKPTMILFKTDMGHGVDFMAGTCKWHGKAPNAEQCAEAMKQLGETPLGDF